jgi:hypothetical protein
MPQIRLKAEIVLQDCKHAIADYNLNLQSEKLRIRWISIITLLRAVGHVLKNVDTTQDPKLKAIILKKFMEIKDNQEKHHIYNEFIVKERNRFLKEYEHGFKRILQPKPSPKKLPKNIIRFSSSSDVSRNSGGIIVVKDSDEIISSISSGYFKGSYEKDVALMAYNWWLSLIKEIKDEYESS